MTAMSAISNFLDKAELIPYFACASVYIICSYTAFGAIAGCPGRLLDCRECTHAISPRPLGPTVKRPAVVSSLGRWPHYPYLFSSGSGDRLLSKEVYEDGR